MSTEGGDVKFRFGADSGPVLNELAKIEGGSNAMAGKVTASASKASKAVGDLGDSAAKGGTKFDKLGKAMGPLGGVLARISPEAGAVASSIAGATSALEGMAGAGLTLQASIPILGAISLAVAGVALAYQHFNHESVIAEQLEATRQLGSAAMLGLDKDLRIAKLDLAGATLELTKQEVQYQKIAFGSEEKVTAALAPLKEQAKALSDQRGSWADLGSQLVNTLGSVIPGSVDSYSQSLAENEAALMANAAEQDRVIAKAKELRVTLQEVDKATAANATTKRAATKQSADDEAAADAKIAAVMAEDAHRIALRDEHRMESAKRQLQAHNDELKMLAERAEAEAKADESRAIAAAKRVEQEQSYQDAALTVGHAVANLADQQLQNQINNLDTSTKAGKEAAKELWDQQLALGIAMAVLDAARAVSAASTLPPPASFIAMGVAAAVGVANVAAVASTAPPKFHTGTSRVRQPNEVAATLTKDEAVMTGPAADRMGRGNIDRMNSGRPASPQSITVVQAVDHRVFHRTVRDNLALNGPLYKATSAASGVPVGHRSSR